MVGFCRERGSCAAGVLYITFEQKHATPHHDDGKPTDLLPL